MEINILKTGKTLLSGQIVFEATVSLSESGTFPTMEERESWVAEKTGYLNSLNSVIPEKKVKGRPKKVASEEE